MKNLPFLCFLVLTVLGCSVPTVADQVCFKDKCIFVELAQTQAERAQGLKERESLGEDKGMLFIFPESKKHSFWMKDTLIPLDMIWIDHNQKIVHIEHNVPSCKKGFNCHTYAPPKNALYVLEINAGKAKELGMLVDMQLDLKIGSLMM